MIALDKAKKALEMAEVKAIELGVKISIVVVDKHGTMIAVSKMDGSIPISPRFAYAKAFTASNLGMPSEALEQFAGPGKPYYGINMLFGGELTTIAGGLPVMADGQVLGAVGVGGSPDTQQDVQCAMEAIKVLQA